MDQPINILIVDDEPKNLTVLETVLADPGYRLVRAESADQALLALVAEEFALLILDIRMPGMTGFELAQIIKERRKTARVPIIFLTAYYNEDQHVLTGYDSGAVDYLHKPVNASILRSKVAVFAELHRTQRECGLANRTLLAEMTERRRAEEQLRVLNETLEQRVAERTEALREREERLRRIFKQSPAGIVQTDVHGNMTLVNDRWCEMLGFSRAELLGRNVADVTDASSLELTCENVRWLAEGGPDFQIEKNYRRKDGTILQVQSNMAGLRDAAGRYQGLLAVVLDITERKRAEETVTRLAAIVESSHDALFSEDREGIVTSWNRGAEQIFGYRADEIIGTSIMRLIPEARQEAEHEMQRNIAAGQRGGTFETIRQAKDGREFHASITVSPLKNAAGKIIGSSRVVRDITERKAAEEALLANEERMRLATEATEVGIWEWNLFTGFIHWDAQMFRIYGVAPTADGLVTYETWRRALLPEDLVPQEELLADTVRRLGKSTRDFRIVRADNGECRWIQAVETVRTNEEGKAEWLVGTNLDVTARTNAERAIREEAQRKDEFLAMLGHELRNPLNAIRHALQIGVEAPQNHVACQAAAKVIDRQSMQLSRMVDDLLDVARINRGRVELRVEALDLGPVLEQAIAAVRPLFDGRGQTFTSDIGSQLRVNGDAPRLEQVFVNLLTNAAKYTPGNGRISLHARHQKGEVVVTITDSGAGIPPELLPRIFDLFRQADSTLDRALGGLGIGLNVVKSLVEMHFGRVTVESPGTNAGTTATVSLPSLLEWSAAGSAPAAPPIAAAPPKPVRVLIVDDHIDAA